MTNYKPNVWYGWNGGECPVHPKTKVEGIWFCHRTKTTGSYNGIADNTEWDIDPKDSNIVAFRVTKEYRKPREFWIVGGCEAWDDEAEAHASLARLGNKEIIHVREVLE